MAHNPSTSFELIRLKPGLSVDPVSGRAGEIYYNNTTNTMRYFDGSSWANFGGVWANQNLSNLLTTSINQDLLADTTLARNLGSASLVWATASIQGINQVATISDLYMSGIQIFSQSTAGSDNSGGLSLTSGDSVNGATGGILIRSGTPSGGTTVFTQQVADFSTTAFNFDATAIGTRIAGVQLVAPSSGVLSSITLKLQNATATPDTYTAQLLVYNDIAGNPGSIINQSTVQVIPIAGSTTIDQVFTFQFPVNVVSSQTYYFLLTAQSVASTLNLLGSVASVGAQNLTTSTNSGGSWTISAFPDPYYILYNSPTRGTIDLDGGVARLMNQSPLRFMNPGSTNYVAFKAPTTIGTNVTWTLPNTDGTSGQALVTSGSGVLSFTTIASASASGPAGSVQFSNGATFASDSANFFWDDTNNRLGVGTNTPNGIMSVFTAGNHNASTGVGSATTFSIRTSGAELSIGLDLTGVFPNFPLYLQGRQAVSNPWPIVFNPLGGNVGVGTLAPSVQFHTTGVVRFANYGAGVPVFSSTGVISSTSLTTGSVAFGSSGVLAQDNTNFFWDNTNKRLGIGTATPGYPFHVVNALGGYSAVIKNTTQGSLILAEGFDGTRAYLGAQGVLSGGGTETNHPFSIRTNNITRIYITAAGAIQFSTGYGAGASVFDASGNISSVAPGTSGNILTSNGTTWISSTPSFAPGTGTADTIAAYNGAGNLTASGPSYSSGSMSFTSTAVGFGRLAFGKTIPGGGPITASGEGSLAFGQLSGNATAQVTASGPGSLAFGLANTTGQISSSGSGTFAAGYAAFGGAATQIVASGNGAFSQGRVITSGVPHSASGHSAFNTGEGNTTSGDNAFSAGMGHLNGSYANFVIGRWSTAAGTAGSWITTDPLFVVGIGASGASRANAFKIQKDGKLFILDPSLAGAVNGYTWTLANQSTGEGAWAAAAAGSPTVEYRTLTGGEAAANQLTLTGTPATPSKTLADIFSGGGPMEYTAEFTVTGTTFDWSGGVYAGVLVAGDRIRITYWI